MRKYTINPYALISKYEHTYFFIGEDGTQPITLELSKKQEELLSSMLNGKFIDYETICEFFDSKLVDLLILTAILVDKSPDTVSLFSRTDAYFNMYGMKEARAKLSTKSVIILGCGGIGSHIAWHMAILGIRKIILVDYDTVEESNLNRQLLYNTDDLGESKVKVLKSKIKKINDQIEVEDINIEINSKTILESLLKDHPADLIIKSLDSPNEFPIWLDELSKEFKYTYVSGITLRQEALIGPTFIPNRSEVGMSDILPIKDNSQITKLGGLSPSLGIVLYHISDEVATEAFKILTGYGIPKYEGKILVENILNNTNQLLSNNSQIDVDVTDFRKTPLIFDLFTIILISIICIFVPLNSISCFIISMCLPFIIYHKKALIIKCSFVNLTISSTLFIISLLYNGFFSFATENILQLLILVIILFCFESILLLFGGVINTLLCKILKIK